MPMLSKEPCATMDGTGQRIKASKPGQPAKEKERREREIMGGEDNLRSGQGTPIGAAAPVSRDKAMVMVNQDPGMRIGAKEEARKDLMDQITEVPKGDIHPGRKSRGTRRRWCHNVPSATRLTPESAALGLAASVQLRQGRSSCTRL